MSDKSEYLRRYRAENKEKIKLAARKHYLANREKRIEEARQYRTVNKHKINAKLKEKYIQKKDEILARNSKHYHNNKDKIKKKRDEYRKSNLALHNYRGALRHAAKLRATPKWLTDFDKQYIKHIYIQAKELQKLDRIPREVDHIIPLQGETVCGLHVPWNLQILTKSENSRKKNKLAPELICQQN
jgi:5-methylcytosine-specific restriction endonuclease McrA